MTPSDGHKTKIAITVDFEDFAHDLLRLVGCDEPLRVRAGALDAAFDAIDGYLRRHFADPRATFFCTGIVAQKHPAVIARIAAAGHEVACHYHYHDLFNADAPALADVRLQEALEHLRGASGQPVLGFRAPRFSLTLGDRAHLDLVARHFAYDSSLHFDSAVALAAADLPSGLTEIPVGRHRLLRGVRPVKTGGSYYKLFPHAVVRAGLRASAANGLLPVLYLHPYDVLAAGGFHLSWDEWPDMGLAKKTYWHLRQRQWTSVFNNRIPSKLAAIAQEFDHIGPLAEYSGLQF